MHRIVRAAAGLWPILVLSACGPLLPEGQEVVVRSGGDLLAAGRTVVTADSLSGDAMLAGRVVGFSGTTEGSVLAAGAEQRIGGRVGGNVLAVGGLLIVTATSDRNLVAAGADVSLPREAVVGRNAYVAGGRVEHRGSVRGALRIAAREVVLDGVIEGDVDVVAERLTVGPRAAVGGALGYRVADGGLTIDPSARLSGGAIGTVVPPRSRGPMLVFMGLRLLAFLVVGAVLAASFRGTLARTADQIGRDPLAAAGLGVLWLLAVPLIVFATFVTVLGIPLAVIVALLFLIALYVAPVVPATALGGRLVRGAPLPAFLAGGTLLGVGMLLPWVGIPLRIVATAVGVGSVVLSIRERWRA